MSKEKKNEIQVTADKVREFLQENEDVKYRNFHSSLLPGVSNVMGVRLPVLRKYAKQISAMNWQEWFIRADDQWYEETMLRGLVIAYAKMDCGQRLKYVEKFVPDINSWGVCDCFCSTLKDADKYPKEYWDFIEKYLISDREYEARFAAVMLLGHFVKREYLEESIQSSGDVLLSRIIMQRWQWRGQFPYILRHFRMKCWHIYRAVTSWMNLHIRKHYRRSQNLIVLIRK